MAVRQARQQVAFDVAVAGDERSAMGAFFEIRLEGQPSLAPWPRLSG
jgi:hypothetical protein